MAGPENGGLIFYPGSHQLGELAVERLTPPDAPSQFAGALALRSVLPDELEPFHPRVRKGTSFFFHALMAHASNPNVTTDRFRQSFLATYIQTGQPFRPGYEQKRVEIDLYATP